MKFDPSLPRDGINVSRTHPLREALVLVLGVVVAAGAAWFFWRLGSTLAPLIFLMFALTDLFAYRRPPRPPAPPPQPPAETSPDQITGPEDDH